MTKIEYTLIKAIRALGALGYDALRDTRDLLERDILNTYIEKASLKNKKVLVSKRNRLALRLRGRHSRPEGGNALTLDALVYPSSLQDVNLLTLGEREALLEVARQLIKAKAPKSAITVDKQGLRVARGTFQVKTKKDHFIVKDEKGEPLLDEEGNKIKKDAHYLYFRIYTKNLDDVERNASVYIGSLNTQEPKPFLLAVDAGREAEERAREDARQLFKGKPKGFEAYFRAWWLENYDDYVTDEMITRDDLMDAFERGGYDEIKAWRNDMDSI